MLEKGLSHRRLITVSDSMILTKSTMLSRDGANGYFISTSRTKMLNPGDWKSDITSNIPTESNGKILSIKGYGGNASFLSSFLLI